MPYLERFDSIFMLSTITIFACWKNQRIEKHQFIFDSIEPSIKLNFKEPTMTHPWLSGWTNHA